MRESLCGPCGRRSPVACCRVEDTPVRYSKSRTSWSTTLGRGAVWAGRERIDERGDIRTPGGVLARCRRPVHAPGRGVKLLAVDGGGGWRGEGAPVAGGLGGTVRTPAGRGSGCVGDGGAGHGDGLGRRDPATAATSDLQDGVTVPDDHDGRRRAARRDDHVPVERR